eukprot:CAMPEP_0114604938 /NCGR_PEP_ID=MMETSP0168-20121206/800_1 /TAXON_ID=95228 ORGANISM="Vannella sp., Strain DIVA3 517/6/12" /NCGR_SAMPLE_ID=MMETSP0168 /ASSEMBLY_ACC=CAM_ASM_000044 /LENGTH=193 /DNA_ID=CAMNT_0001815779 /DNA_START=57 /DNA_END=634 /DNA_ORIENTATION=+
MSAGALLVILLATVSQACDAPCASTQTFFGVEGEARLTAWLHETPPTAVMSANMVTNGTTLYLEYMDTSQAEAKFIWHEFPGLYTPDNDLSMDLSVAPGFFGYVAWSQVFGLQEFGHMAACSTEDCCCSSIAGEYSYVYYCQCRGQGLLFNPTTTPQDISYYCYLASGDLSLQDATIGAISYDDPLSSVNWAP